MLKVKFIFSFVVILLLFTSLKSNAAIIPNSAIDTYTIKLQGAHINEVSALNVTVKLPRKQADLSTSVSFTGNGASALFSSITGPNAEEYVISIALNGKIKDQTAIISGKFVDFSVLAGGEFLVTKVVRDGGLDITSLVTNEITFSNSKATPTPTPSASATPSASSTPAATASPTPSLSSEQQQVVDILVGENNTLEIDPSTITEKLADDENEKLKINSSDKVQMRSNGLNKIYVRLNGLFKDDERRSYIGFNKIFCYILAGDTDNNNKVNYLAASNPVLYTSFKSNRKVVHRFSKRASISILPSPGSNGEKLMNRSIDEATVSILPYCFALEMTDQEVKKLANENFHNDPSELQAVELVEYILSSSYRGEYEISMDVKQITILAPKLVDVKDK